MVPVMTGKCVSVVVSENLDAVSSAQFTISLMIRSGQS